MLKSTPPRRWRIVDFAEIAGVACPCGTARRAFADVADFPVTVHRTDISADARVHYHRRLTEVYYILECGPDAEWSSTASGVPLRAGQLHSDSAAGAASRNRPDEGPGDRVAEVRPGRRMVRLRG